MITLGGRADDTDWYPPRAGLIATPDIECEYITWHDRANYHRRCRTKQSDGTWSDWVTESCGVCYRAERVAPCLSEEEARSIEKALGNAREKEPVRG